MLNQLWAIGIFRSRAFGEGDDSHLISYTMLCVSKWSIHSRLTTWLTPAKLDSTKRRGMDELSQKLMKINIPLSCVIATRSIIDQFLLHWEQPYSDEGNTSRFLFWTSLLINISQSSFCFLTYKIMNSSSIKGKKLVSYRCHIYWALLMWESSVIYYNQECDIL